MTRLEAVIERLKALPEDRQEAVANGIEHLLDAETRLSAEQWAEIDRRTANDAEEVVSHESVVAHMRARYGG